MPSRHCATPHDAIVVGSGPNGLAAAITLSQAGRSVLVVEAKGTAGGGLRSAELTLPGYIHDVCAAVHPLGVASPFFRAQPLGEYGLSWVFPPVELAHPLDDGTVVLLERSIERTARGLGPDGQAYSQLMAPLVADWESLLEEVLAPLHVPRRPLLYARFGLTALQPAASFARRTFRGERARALFAGLAAHSSLPLSASFTAAFGLVLGMLGHAVGWPLARGGSQRIADALIARLAALGGSLEMGQPVTQVGDLPPARHVLLDLTPRQIAAMAGDALPDSYLRRLSRYRYGPGVFKVDYALEGPIPWKAADCARAATVHLGGSLEEIAASEAAVSRGKHPERPFVILVQPSDFDETRAPAERATAWAYCHVPNGSAEDMAERIENQIERFAPGFRNRVLARRTRNTSAMEHYNANYVGGDINGGLQDWRQMFARPVMRRDPYRTPERGLLICSSSTPPGGGVHGMCGFHAARSALRDFKRG
jgi:phytoene dehydrogenase-like protein